MIATLCARIELSDSLLTETFVVNSQITESREEKWQLLSKVKYADHPGSRHFAETLVGCQARSIGVVVNAREKMVASECRGHRRL